MDVVSCGRKARNFARIAALGKDRQLRLLSSADCEILLFSNHDVQIDATDRAANVYLDDREETRFRASRADHDYTSIRHRG